MLKTVLSGTVVAYLLSTRQYDCKTYYQRVPLKHFHYARAVNRGLQAYSYRPNVDFFQKSIFNLNNRANFLLRSLQSFQFFLYSIHCIVFCRQTLFMAFLQWMFFCIIISDLPACIPMAWRKRKIE